MTKKNLYPSKFWNWQGWDFIKWPFAMIVLSLIIGVIWMGAVDRLPATLKSKHDRVGFDIYEVDNQIVNKELSKEAARPVN